MDRPSADTRGVLNYGGADLFDHYGATSRDAADDGWLISFVDILTVLLTLFALLLATAYARRQDMPQRLIHAPPVSKATMPRSATAPPPRPASLSGVTAEPAPAAIPPQGRDAHTETAAAVTPAPPRQTAARPPSAPAAVTLALAGLPATITDNAQVTGSAARVNLLIKSEVLFDVGRARLRAPGLRLLDRIAHWLTQNDYPVSVEGNTDDMPIHTARFPSNWELSTARATAVTRYLIQRGVAAGRLRAVGFGDTRPVADNDSPAGRRQNRRVALVVHLHKPARAARLRRNGVTPPP